MVTGTFIFLMIVIMIVCAILVLVILSQDPKGGGLTSTFGGSGSQMFGVKRTNTFLDKATWTLAIVIAATVIISNIMIPRSGTQNLPEIDLPEIPATEQTAPATTAPADNSTAPVENTTAPATTEETE